jgi:hypothetical protein
MRRRGEEPTAQVTEHARQRRNSFLLEPLQDLTDGRQRLGRVGSLDWRRGGGHGAIDRGDQFTGRKILPGLYRPQARLYHLRRNRYLLGPADWLPSVSLNDGILGPVAYAGLSRVGACRERPARLSSARPIWDALAVSTLRAATPRGGRVEGGSFDRSEARPTYLSPAPIIGGNDKLSGVAAFFASNGVVIVLPTHLGCLRLERSRRPRTV